MSQDDGSTMLMERELDVVMGELEQEIPMPAVYDVEAARGTCYRVYCSPLS